MFNPNEVGIDNGNLFGFPYSIEESDIIVIPVQLDITCSYVKGTSEGPKAILGASTQLDFYSPHLKNAWQTKVAMLPLDEQKNKENKRVGEVASGLIKKLEKGLPIEEKDREKYRDINQHCENINLAVEKTANKSLEQGKKVCLLGGDHSSPLGLIRALSRKHERFGILQIDAHADLRNAYEGFEYSHASIMFNALKIKSVSKLVQVGVRDICPEEEQLIKNSSNRIKTFFDWDLKAEQYEGKTWQQQCSEIIEELPELVYVSYDVDGLDPKLCPSTGTPVAGGFEVEQINYLLKELTTAGKKIIGFDLCEVGNSDWDANVGARVLYRLCNFLAL